MTFSSLPGLCIRRIYDISRDGPYIFEEKLYLFIYLLIERWPKCADLWIFGKDWSVSLFSSISQTITYYGSTNLDHCANRDLHCLPYVWSICLRMDTPFCFYFLFFTNILCSPSKVNLLYHSHSKESPNSPGKASVR